MAEIEILRADLERGEHRRGVLAMLDGYAADAMGDGKPLSEFARDHLIAGLRAHPTTLVWLALADGEPCGIAVCFRGFSTFAARPLVNVHDLYVFEPLRGTGIGARLLGAVEQEARALGCCKLTLEVQELNARAREVYQRSGFTQARYAPEAGGALFLAKLLG